MKTRNAIALALLAALLVASPAFAGAGTPHFSEVRATIFHQDGASEDLSLVVSFKESGLLPSQTYGYNVTATTYHNWACVNPLSSHPKPVNLAYRTWGVSGYLDGQVPDAKGAFSSSIRVVPFPSGPPDGLEEKCTGLGLSTVLYSVSYTDIMLFEVSNHVSASPRNVSLVIYP
jgi:hypothetical protein